jgi:hypothetical protein
VVVRDSQPPTVEAIATSIPARVWYRRTVSKGTKGPITYEFTKRRVTLCRAGLPDRAVWLVCKRTLGEHPSYWYYISNAPLSSRLPLFVWLSGVRWAVEQCFEEAKTEVGMDHYEIRQYPGWHHRMLTCMIAHFFLWHLKVRLGKKAPALTVSQLRMILEVVLPLRTLTLDDVLELVAWVQRRNYGAYLSHRKRRETEG